MSVCIEGGYLTWLFMLFIAGVIYDKGDSIDDSHED